MKRNYKEVDDEEAYHHVDHPELKKIKINLSIDERNDDQQSTEDSPILFQPHHFSAIIK